MTTIISMTSFLFIYFTYRPPIDLEIDNYVPPLFFVLFFPHYFTEVETKASDVTHACRLELRFPHSPNPKLFQLLKGIIEEMDTFSPVILSQLLKITSYLPTCPLISVIYK